MVLFSRKAVIRELNCFGGNGPACHVPSRPCAEGPRVWPIRRPTGVQRPLAALCRGNACLATTAAVLRATSPPGPVPGERMFGHYGRPSCTPTAGA